MQLLRQNYILEYFQLVRARAGRHFVQTSAGQRSPLLLAGFTVGIPQMHLLKSAVLR